MCLISLGLSIRDMETQRSRLEEVFLQLTGIDENRRKNSDAS